MMKKKMQFVGLFLMILFLTTGCYDYKTEMTVNKDRSVDFGMSLNIDLSSVKDMYGDEFGSTDDMDLGETSGFDDEAIKSLEDRGFTVKTTEEEYKYGVSVSKKYANIDDISSLEDVKVDVDKITEEDFKDIFFKKEKGMLKTKYIAYLTFDLTDADTDTEELEAYKDYFNISYVLNLPDEALSSNATSLSNDKKTLTWDLEMGKKNEVIYEFELPNENSVVIMGVAIAGIVIVVAAVAVVIVKSKKKNSPKQNEEVAKN